MAPADILRKAQQTCPAGYTALVSQRYAAVFLT
jgi:hypothetical protein